MSLPKLALLCTVPFILEGSLLFELRGFGSSKEGSLLFASQFLCSHLGSLPFALSKACPCYSMLLLFSLKIFGFAQLQSLDRIKCRLLEGTNAQEVRAMVLDMQARLLLDMLGKGIESALLNPSALVAEPWQASGETLSNIDPEAMAVEPSLVPSIQVCYSYILNVFLILFD